MDTKYLSETALLTWQEYNAIRKDQDFIIAQKKYEYRRSEILFLVTSFCILYNIEGICKHSEMNGSTKDSFTLSSPNGW
ncbi:hypothetical protein Mapa_000413 [Marchantia paleacea]|nr:hypothetical protein Mapa_000413 [Marchantia paleacea]